MKLGDWDADKKVMGSFETLSIIPYDICVGIPFSCRIKLHRPWINARLTYCLNSVLNVEVLIGDFNQEKALVGAFKLREGLFPDLLINHHSLCHTKNEWLMIHKWVVVMSANLSLYTRK